MKTRVTMHCRIRYSMKARVLTQCQIRYAMKTKVAKHCRIRYLMKTIFTTQNLFLSSSKPMIQMMVGMTPIKERPATRESMLDGQKSYLKIADGE